MSRAFVKENDLEHAGIDIPERPLSEEPNYVTPRGLKLLNQNIDVLEKERESLNEKKDDPMVKMAHPEFDPYSASSKDAMSLLDELIKTSSPITRMDS